MIYIPIWKVTPEINYNCGWVMQAVGIAGNILSPTYDKDLMVPGRSTGVQSIWNTGVC